VAGDVSLKPSELTDAMKTAFAEEWHATNGGSPPSVGTVDPRLLFAAVAHGLLHYLDDHEEELLSRFTFEDSGQERGVAHGG
jgi:hypothetical protein